MTGRVRVEREGGLLEIVLSAGDRGNALDLQAAEELGAVSHRLADPGLTSVLLRAEGRNFCVGGDLRDFAGRGDETEAHVRAVAEAVHEAVFALAQAHVPVVSAVQGAVAGAGIGLALCADVVLAATSAKFRLAYTAVGLSPDCGASWFLPRLIGPRRALDLALTNRVLTVDEALAWGLVSRVVQPEVLAEDARATAAGLADRQFAETKRLIGAATGRSLDAHLADEARTIAGLSGEPATQAVIQAFTAR